MPTNLTLADFIDRLIDEKHAGVSIPAENREQMKQEMMTALNKMISLKMLEQLTPQELTEFQRLEDSDGATDDQLQQYIATHVGPKIKEKDVFLAQILGEFRELYLG